MTKHHETLFQSWSQWTLQESRGGPSGKKPSSKGFRLVVNSVVFSYVAGSVFPYTL